MEREKELNNNSKHFKNNINLIKYDSIVVPLYFTYKFGFNFKLAKIYLNWARFQPIDSNHIMSTW